MCPGLYCGRTLNLNGSWSECGACPRGYRANQNRECILCDSDPSSYDIFFLGFMFMLPLIMHCYFININSGNIKKHMALVGSACLEVVLSAGISLIFMNPVGSFRIHTCGVRNFSDWYTLFYNPTPDYKVKLYCTQEAVYPLQTIVLVFYFVCLLQMVFLRSLLNNFGIRKRNAAYSALYFFPILMLLHSMTCGLIYYGFPHLSIIMSMVTNACHQSFKSERSMKSIFKACFSESRNVLIIGGHWFLLAYGIMSLRHRYIYLVLVPIPLLFFILTLPLTDPRGHWFLLAYGIMSLRHRYIYLVLVPIPLLFFILTLPLTDPSEFVECEERC